MHNLGCGLYHDTRSAAFGVIGVIGERWTTNVRR
jgi:hypothetical protein